MITETKFKYGTVMLVDDNDIDNFVNRKTLEHVHFAERIIAFISPVSALEYIASTQTDNTESMEHLPQIIFLDLNMPCMNGYEFVQEFQKINPTITQNIRIVMLTSSLNHADRDQSLLMKPVTHFISKPLERKHLQEV